MAQTEKAGAGAFEIDFWKDAGLMALLTKLG